MPLSHDQQLAEWGQLLAQLAAEHGAEGDEERSASTIAALLDTIPSDERLNVLYVTVMGLGQALHRLAHDYATLEATPAPRLRRR